MAVSSAAGPVLVSACLLGEPCRYDGKAQPCADVIALGSARELVPACPERLGGLPTPRVPSEVQPDGRVVDAEGLDRTEAFEAGARAALRIARERGCKTAVLKENSPSCGVNMVYDGSFSGRLVPGRGKTARLLEQAGLVVMSESDCQAGGLPRLASARGTMGAWLARGEEARMLFLHYPKCSTCRKALKWLEGRGVEFESRDIVQDNPTAAELRAWHEASGLPLRRFFNTSGVLYRDMGLKDKLPTMSEDEMYELLASDGMLVKRPLLVLDGAVLAGFREAEWEGALNGR